MTFIDWPAHTGNPGLALDQFFEWGQPSEFEIAVAHQEEGLVQSPHR